ncbi:MAG: hypothetical protein IPM96_21750 [Ignavibacteria bacterium]|nr:hypothetical protein [Ignavibacteria bacterium]
MAFITNRKVNYSEDSKLEVENIGLHKLLVAGNIEIGKFSDYFYGNTMSLIRNNITTKSTTSEKYFQVNLSPGYYIASTYDFTDKIRHQNQAVFNFIIEIIDDPFEEGV